MHICYNHHDYERNTINFYDNELKFRTSSAEGLSLEECFQQSYIKSISPGKEGSALPSLTSGLSPLMTAWFSSCVVVRLSNGR